MSLLFVSYNQEKQDFATVSIMRKVANFLFDNVIEPLAKNTKDKDFLDKADADLLDENVDLSKLGKDEFNQAYQLIKKNASEPALQPYVKEILDKMQADPRYTT